MRTLIPKTQVMNIHIIGSGGKKRKEKKKKKIVSDWLYANEFVLGVWNCGGKNNFAPRGANQRRSREVWGNLISGNRHYICMKIRYFGQSLIIYLSEINSHEKQTYLAYISCPASEVRTCKLHCRVRETPRLASCIAVYASEFGGI